MAFIETLFLWIATSLGWAFVITYMVLAPWHKYVTGRHMMVGSLVLAMILTYLLLRYEGVLRHTSDLTRHIVASTIYASLAVVMGWRLVILVRIQVPRVLRKRARR